MGTKTKSRFQPHIVEAYTLIAHPGCLRHITPETLADIHDAAFKFGLEDFFKGLCILDIAYPTRFRIMVSATQNDPAMVILKDNDEEDHDVLEVPFEENMEKSLLWDVKLDPVVVTAGIHMLDKQMLRRGYINPKTGVRLRVVNDFLPVLYRVADLFSIPGTTHYTPDTPKEIEHARQQFDFPDQVTVWKDENEELVFCHKRDLPYLEIRLPIILAVAKSWGLEPADIQLMNEKEYSAFEKEVNEEMAKLGFTQQPKLLNP